MLRRTAVTTVVAAALVAPVLPSLATTTVTTPVLRTVALALGTTTAAVTDERLVGVTWESGTPQVRVRWRTGSGWTAWDSPETEGPAGATPSTEPLWRPTGATRVAVEVTGRASGVRLVRVSDSTRRVVLRQSEASAATSAKVVGSVRTRKDWGADESIRKGRATYAKSVRAVVVHHTVQRNDYAASEVPALIRADYAYHVRGRGWDDLGYNLMIDRFGGVWEGRRGGLGRATIGTHAAGFNTGTLGVAVLGDYTRTQPTEAVTRALAKVVGYAAKTWRWDPSGKVTLTSQGSPRYRSGRRVTLPRVLGHKQTGTTACPGSLMDVLARVRVGAKVLMQPAPAIAETAVTGAPVHAPQPLVVTARVSSAAPWRLELHDDRGELVTSASGTGTAARLEWDGTRPSPVTLEGGPSALPAPPGTYAWTLVVDDGWHDPATATGTVEVGLPLLPL